MVQRGRLNECGHRPPRPWWFRLHTMPAPPAMSHRGVRRAPHRASLHARGTKSGTDCACAPFDSGDSRRDFLRGVVYSAKIAARNGDTMLATEILCAAGIRTVVELEATGADELDQRDVRWVLT